MSTFPISKVCPQCGATEYTTKPPRQFIAFAKDRVCKACETRYTPPTPVWAAIVFILAGIPLLALGVFTLVVPAIRGNPAGMPSMMFGGFLGALGVFAIGQGIRPLKQPGKV
jgi:hypothetical protein